MATAELSRNEAVPILVSLYPIRTQCFYIKYSQWLAHANKKTKNITVYVMEGIGTPGWLNEKLFLRRLHVQAIHSVLKV